MRVQLITNLFFPDELAGAALYTDLARFLKEKGHDLRVTTTFSYYPKWQLDPADQGVAVRDESFHGIVVRRVGMYVPRIPSGAKRTLSDLSFLWKLVRYGKFTDWTPEIIITASPMFSQCLAQRFLYSGKRIPRMIIVQDFVVDAALELGILKLPLASSLLRRLERWSFRSAKTLSTISNPMLEKLKEKVGSDRRLLYIPNWIHRSLEQEIRKQIGQYARGAQRLFYSGNVGVKQGLPDFAESFQLAATAWELQINGGGAEIERLRNKTAGAKNISIGSVLEEKEYVAGLLQASACLITQKAGVGANFLPSKLLPALASGTPVLAVCEEGTPLAQEVRSGAFGAVIPPGDKEALKLVLNRWDTNPAELQKLSGNAALHSCNFSRKTILEMYETEMLRLVNEPDG